MSRENAPDFSRADALLQALLSGMLVRYYWRMMRTWLWFVARLLGSIVVIGSVASCAPDSGNLPTEAVVTPNLDSTVDPVLVQTLQADAEATAIRIATLPVVPTSTPAPLPPGDTISGGTPAASRIGNCPVPDGSVLNTREGFCIAAPANWVVLNVDGGLAGALNTTPGRAISLRPDWALSSNTCLILIYVANEASARNHLDIRNAEFATRSDLNYLSPIQDQALGEVSLMGFSWISEGGETGSIFAALLGINRVLHVSFGGTDCPQESLIPTLNTMRFQSQ